MTKDFTIRRRDDNIAVVELDVQGKSVNPLSTTLGRALVEALDDLEQDPSVEGLVISSAKPDCFIAGADIDELKGLDGSRAAQDFSSDAQKMLDRLAQLKVPVVAAIHGACLGGGLELALACHGRVCSDDNVTALGLPEVQLGVIPAAGGTQRLPRLIGVQAALDMILTAKRLRPRQALKLGLVDEVVPRVALERAAVARLQLLRKERAGREGRGKLLSELKELRKQVDGKELIDLALGGNPLGRRVVFGKGRDMVQRKTRGHYPAPFGALLAVEVGLAEGMERGLQVEAEQFGQLAVSDVSKRLIELFQATQALKKDSGVGDAEVEPQAVGSLGVLGGGLMGTGIAYVSARKGVDVRLKERDHTSAAKTLGAVWKLLAKGMERKRMTEREAQQTLAHVSVTPELTGLGRADLVVEAVFEDLKLKQELLAALEERVPERCVIASNTSSIPISHIVQGLKKPERALGMHFFSPVHKMPLLEVISTEMSDDKTVATAVAFGKRLNKQTIVVRDGPGFYTTRILAPYLGEASRLLAEGAAIDDVDRAMVDFGFPVGPFVLLDEVGIDIGAHVAQVLHDAFGDRMQPVESMRVLVDDGRLGRKSGRGLYTYDGKKKRVDETVYDLLPGGRERRLLDAQEIQQRLCLSMVNEAAHCLGEGVLRQPRDGDVGAVFGLGFPPFRGGPFRYIDALGARTVVDQLARLGDRHGARFEAAPALTEAAAGSASFYPEA